MQAQPVNELPINFYFATLTRVANFAASLHRHNHVSRFGVPVSSGFNTNVRVGDRVFHVQTEDRGPSPAVIDTIVYVGGRIVHRQSYSYRELAAAHGFTQEMLHERVEEHHREVIESLRNGSLSFDATLFDSGSATVPSAIAIRIMQFVPRGQDGQAILRVEVLNRNQAEPVAGARIGVSIEGAASDLSLQGISDINGQCELRFTMPSLRADGAVFCIKASTVSTQESMKYALRPKAKSPASHPQNDDNR